MTMLKELSKETHVFLKTEDSFTAIAKRPVDNTYQVFTTKIITTHTADDINLLYGANLEVTRINFDQGFLIIKLKGKSTYRHIVKAIKSVLYDKKVDPKLKRRYNLCYRARQKGYKILTPTRTIYRPDEIDSSLEKQLYEYGFAVQLKIFR